jgi:hypothetical protein
MATDTGGSRVCPHCREGDLQPDAVLCKHCGSRLTPERPPHGGICPYCKEQINPEATKCKHCGSNVGIDRAEARPGGCGCEGGSGRSLRDYSTYDPACVTNCVAQCQLYGFHPAECYPFCANLCTQHSPQTLPLSLRGGRGSQHSHARQPASVRRRLLGQSSSPDLDCAEWCFLATLGYEPDFTDCLIYRCGGTW